VKIYLLEATKENMPVILQCSKQQNDMTGGGTVTSNLVQMMVSIMRI
jgi:fructose/tagatose bisphosphate aldolase